VGGECGDYRREARNEIGAHLVSVGEEADTGPNEQEAKALQQIIGEAPERIRDAGPATFRNSSNSPMTPPGTGSAPELLMSSPTGANRAPVPPQRSCAPPQ
jgi:hypothetical protein